MFSAVLCRKLIFYELRTAVKMVGSCTVMVGLVVSAVDTARPAAAQVIVGVKLRLTSRGCWARVLISVRVVFEVTLTMAMGGVRHCSDMALGRCCVILCC